MLWDILRIMRREQNTDNSSSWCIDGIEMSPGATAPYSSIPGAGKTNVKKNSHAYLIGGALVQCSCAMASDHLELQSPITSIYCGGTAVSPKIVAAEIQTSENLRTTRSRLLT